jgi:hypothetical protein
VLADIRWQGAPKGWLPDAELHFLRELRRGGFAEARAALRTVDAGEGKLPAALLQPEELIRRIQKIDARMRRPKPKAKKAPPKTKKEAAQGTKKPRPGWQDKPVYPGTYRYIPRLYDSLVTITPVAHVILIGADHGHDRRTTDK